MSDNVENTPTDDTDEISLIDLAAVLWRYRKFIIITVILAIVGVVTFAIISLVLPPEKSPLPNQYTPESMMLIHEKSDSGGGLSSMIASSGLGGLAGIAGVSGGGTSNGQLALVICGTNSFLDSVVDRFDLIERLEIKKSVRAESREALKKVLVASLDDETGVFTLKYTDIDPAFAQQVVNYATELLEARFRELGLDQNQLKKENLETSLAVSMSEILRLEEEMQNLELGRAVFNPNDIPRITLESTRLKREIDVQEMVYKQMRQEYELLKITMDSETPVFQILEYAEIPDKKSGPGRGMLCIIVTFAAGFLSVFLTFLFNAVKKSSKSSGIQSGRVPIINPTTPG